MTRRGQLVVGVRMVLRGATLLLSSTSVVSGQVNLPPKTPDLAGNNALDWQTAAGGKMAFEVASVREDPSGKYKPPPYSIDPDDDFAATGGVFTANLSLQGYIDFAYKLPQQFNLLSNLPDWVRRKQFEIQARALPTVTKDQMRLMMQSLLADRFKLALHYETRVTRVQTMTLIRPGIMGPHLRLHADGLPCNVVAPRAAGAAVTFDMFPCHVLLGINEAGGTILAGARDTTVGSMAAYFSNAGHMGPIVDRTGLSGNIDFSMDYLPETRGSPSIGGGTEASVPGATFDQAVKDQLGLKLEPGIAPLSIPVVDHIEMPSEN